jgi:peptidoglycan/xylan/chitin deacetylase (PgdA/CDA1 family)
MKLKDSLTNHQMRNFLVALLLLSSVNPILSQNQKEFTNEIFLKKLHNDTSYLELKKRILSGSAQEKSGQWGEFVKGVVRNFNTRNKVIAFTFDACGGRNGNGYDKELIDFLHNEKVPATLFISGKWIDANFNSFLGLSRDTLFEIENHGLNHKPSSINGNSAYGIKGTSDIGEAFDEMEANALKIKELTKHKPRFYRSATAFIDEACVSMAYQLGIKVISFEILSGDGVPFTPAEVIEENVVKNVKPGSIVMMHLNNPEWDTREAMQKIVPELRQMGYIFVRLNDFE